MEWRYFYPAKYSVNQHFIKSYKKPLAPRYSSLISNLSPLISNRFFVVFSVRQRRVLFVCPLRWICPAYLPVLYLRVHVLRFLRLPSIWTPDSGNRTPYLPLFKEGSGWGSASNFSYPSNLSYSSYSSNLSNWPH